MNSQKSPCKSFNKKAAITCYKLRANNNGATPFEHTEFYRITNQTPGEYYILPIETLQKQINRHISYHKSGAFHWREEDGSRISPTEGEADARRASLINQAMEYLTGQLDGYCIAKGRNVSTEAIDTMVNIMDGYIIPPLKDLRVSEMLKTEKNRTIMLMTSVYKILAQEIIAQEIEQGNQKTFTRNEMITSIRNTLGESVKIVELNPKNEQFVSYSEDAMGKIIKIARQMVDDKMREKPNAFWTSAFLTDKN